MCVDEYMHILAHTHYTTNSAVHFSLPYNMRYSDLEVSSELLKGVCLNL